MERYIELEITDEYIKGGGTFIGAAQSHDDVVLRMHFNELWNGRTKTVQFLDARRTLPATEILLTASMLYNNTLDTYDVPIPYEAKRYAGNIAVTVKGVIVNSTTQLETSATLAVSTQFVVKESLWDNNGQVSQDVTPTQAEQLQQQIDEVLEDISDAIQAAENAATSAEHASSDAGLAQIAKGLAELAKTLAVSAAGTAQNASTSASSSATSAAASKTAIENMTVSSTTLEAGQNPTATKTSTASSFNINFGIPRSSNAVTLTSGQWAAFQVINGHLYVTYPDDEGDVSFSINENGHLIMAIEGV